MKLIKNEMKKIILSRKYLVVMSIFIVLYACISVLMYKDTLKSKPETMLSFNEKNLEYWQNQKKDKDIPKERKNEIEQNIKSIERRNKDLKFQIANKNLDWEKRLTKDNNNLKKQIKESEKNGENAAISEYKQQIAMNDYYLNNNIRPTPNYEITAFNVMPKVNMIIGFLIISIIIAIMTSTSVSGEFNPATIKLLLTKPVSRERVLFSKFMASVLVCILAFLIIKILAFLVLGTVFSFGSFKEPMAYYSRYIANKDLIANIGLGVKPDLSSLKMSSIFKFVVLSEGINMLFIMATVSVCLLISTLTKKSSTSISISGVLFAVISIINTKQLDNATGGNLVIHKVMPYLFSTYSTGELVISREIIPKIGLPFVNIPFIIFILLAWTIGCYLISNFIFVKRDIL
ncbi:ABC transporter permease subunit [Clostridium botulinum]|uniref:ABC transporter permease subunit n=1 Tax=Clostridium botulinum TaxID=1491 RepID=UPI003DA5C96B